VNAGATAAVVVAHPDDEILWCGGLILEHRNWDWKVVTLCRSSDPDRAPRFRSAMEFLNARGVMGDLDDGPRQEPLPLALIGNAVETLLPNVRYDLLLTHGPQGEYTRHRRHEECCRAVLALWEAGRIRADALWLFAYDDSCGAQLPHPRGDADRRNALSEPTWREKHPAMTKIYGFTPDSWEARTTPRVEAFACFSRPAEAAEYVAANTVR
jgi:LmbE family N-acetylglucosaminyl deacetylase